MRSISIYIIVVLFGLLFLASCGNDKQKVDENVTIELDETQQYGVDDFVFPNFDNNSKLQVNQWAVFDDFDSEIRTINGRTKEVLKNKSQRLVTHMDSLSKKIPDTLSSRTIKSRLLVVKTRVHLLDQELNKSKPDSMMIQGHISELNTSYSNLIRQINEKFEKDAIDMQRLDDEKKELEKQKRFLDSVYKAELQDQNK
jgi:hypothetical protein